jgi:hypothetical protein
MTTKPKQALHLAFFATTGGLCLIALVDQTRELRGSTGNLLSSILLLATLGFFLWHMMRYLKIVRGYGAELSGFDWLISLFIAIAGLCCIYSVTEPQIWFRYLAGLSSLDAIKDMQVATYVKGVRKKHHFLHARHQFFFAISLLVISIQASWRINLLGGLYALVYVVIEVWVKARSLKRSRTNLFKWK